LGNISDSYDFIKKIIEPIHALVYSDKREINFLLDQINNKFLAFMQIISKSKKLVLKQQQSIIYIYSKNLHDVMLKIDTKGAELKVLRGSIKSIKEKME
jgi:hypothetical protein